MSYPGDHGLLLRHVEQRPPSSCGPRDRGDGARSTNALPTGTSAPRAEGHAGSGDVSGTRPWALMEVAEPSAHRDPMSIRPTREPPMTDRHEATAHRGRRTAAVLMAGIACTGMLLASPGTAAAEEVSDAEKSIVLVGVSWEGYV